MCLPFRHCLLQPGGGGGQITSGNTRPRQSLGHCSWRSDLRGQLSQCTLGRLAHRSHHCPFPKAREGPHYGGRSRPRCAGLTQRSVVQHRASSQITTGGNGWVPHTFRRSLSEICGRLEACLSCVEWVVDGTLQTCVSLSHFPDHTPFTGHFCTLCE